MSASGRVSVRPPVIAGSWYPGTEQSLARTVDGYLAVLPTYFSIRHEDCVRYYSELAEATSDGYLTKFYFIGGVRVAAERKDAAYEFAALDFGPIAVASVWAGRPACRGVPLLRRTALTPSWTGRAPVTL